MSATSSRFWVHRSRRFPGISRICGMLASSQPGVTVSGCTTASPCHRTSAHRRYSGRRSTPSRKTSQCKRTAPVSRRRAVHLQSMRSMAPHFRLLSLSNAARLADSDHNTDRTLSRSGLDHDMQVGIVPQIEEGAAIVAQCRKLLAAARDKGFRVFS